MGCLHYGPMISRFLDDDLDREEMEGFLEHLFGCEGCTREWRRLQGLRSWFQTVEILDPAPLPRKPFALEELNLEAALLKDVAVGKIPASQTRAGARALGSVGQPDRGWWGGMLLQQLVSQRTLRFAVPMIAAVLLGVWIYPEDPIDYVDVRELPASHGGSLHLSKQEENSSPMDLYVFQHSIHQPRAFLGSEHHIIQTASATYP